jgi:glycosyltransferase involved in cell wall biosynthesis
MEQLKLSMDSYSVSVVIPVFNDCASLNRCLESLQNQTYPEELDEVIVVNNENNRGIEGLISRFERTVLTNEAVPTPGAARNKGISLAKGVILAFTDADCVPAADWIEKGVKNLVSTAGCGLVAGRVHIFYKNPSRPTMVELFDREFGFDQKRYLHEMRFAATANAFAIREIVEKIGKFDPLLKSAEDQELSYLILLPGYKHVYADDTIVFHPARRSFRSLYMKTVRIIGGLHDLKKKRGNSFMRGIFENKKPETLIRLQRIVCGKSINNFRDRIKLFVVFLFVEAVSFYERARLFLGMKSRGWREF